MRLLLDSFWRAMFYALHPRVIALSLLPLLIVGIATFALGYLYWDPMYAWLDDAMRHNGLLGAIRHPLVALFGERVNTFVVTIVIVTLALVAIVPLTLMLAAVCVSPAAVEMVARRRFPLLERRHGGSWWKGFAFSLVFTLGAFALAGALTPLWILPPLGWLAWTVTWGWFTARVMAFDALSEHASADERRALMRAHSWPLLMAGIVTGVLCGLPSMLWGITLLTLAFAPFVLILQIWCYTLIFAFSALWFTHYLLAALGVLRAAEAAMQRGAAGRAMSRAGEGEVIDVEPRVVDEGGATP